VTINEAGIIKCCPFKVDGPGPEGSERVTWANWAVHNVLNKKKKDFIISHV